MVPQEVPQKSAFNFRLLSKKLKEILINSLNLIKEFKGTIIILLLWVLISELAGYSILITFRSIFRLIIYPINWILFKTQFSITEIPQIFILLIPLFILMILNFLIIISTED